jgi:predicted acetyltransferase
MSCRRVPDGVARIDAGVRADASAAVAMACHEQHLVGEDDRVDLRLRPLRLADEAAYRAAHAELLADSFRFGFIQDGESFGEHVRRLERQRRGCDLGDFVEATWLVADVDGQLVGRASIRHQLDDYLAFHGGHIGYGVRPAFRRRGYASEILRQSLIIARSYGVGQVLVTCDDGNVASARVIEACGGELERVVPGDESDHGTPFRRYWIT